MHFVCRSSSNIIGIEAILEMVCVPGILEMFPALGHSLPNICCSLFLVFSSFSGCSSQVGAGGYDQTLSNILCWPGYPSWLCYVTWVL